MDTLSLIVNWFTANKFVWNINKTNIIKFTPKQSSNSSLAVAFGNLFMTEVPLIKFLGIKIVKNLNWKSHVKYILPKLSSAAIVVIRSLSYFMNIKTLQMVYFPYFHSFLKYGIISGVILLIILEFLNYKKKWEGSYLEWDLETDVGIILRNWISSHCHVNTFFPLCCL
jgi:hypothetical protein